MADNVINAFSKGVHNLIDDENIPSDSASDEKNWYTQNGRIKLIPGRLLIGAEGAAGAIYGEIFGYKVNGTKVHWRKNSTKIQYLNSTTWTDVVTGLTADSDYTFANYSSLAGTFTYAFGADGIYKFHNANPGSSIALYDSTKNFKGYAFIDRGRTILWNRKEDKTGLYGSKIDPQNSTVYTTITAENIASGNGVLVNFSGTLAFKGAGATRNCFAVTITATAGESFTDNYDGTLTGSAGGTGTINYITGAWSVTFVTVPANAANNIKATYQWENSNASGVTDFSHSATRLAGEGFQFPQDEGGDAIKVVLISPLGTYVSLKAQSAYELSIAADDITATNLVLRRDIGVPFLRASASTGKGIVFMNTAKYEKPELSLLQKNPFGDKLDNTPLFPHFAFENYNYTDATIATFDRYLLIACRAPDATANDRVLLCDLTNGTVDITAYNARTFASDAGLLYCGSSITQSVYNLFSGYDDDGLTLSNYWISKGEIYKSERLKKFRHFRIKGRIQPTQTCSIYVSYDDADFQLVGTIRGDASYVDSQSAQEIGADIIGDSQVGGDTSTTVYPFFMQLKLKTPKFRSRKIKLQADSIGYLDINSIMDHDIFLFGDKIPTRFRVKENVSLDGATTDQNNPTY